MSSATLSSCRRGSTSLTLSLRGTSVLDVIIDSAWVVAVIVITHRVTLQCSSSVTDSKLYCFLVATTTSKRCRRDFVITSCSRQLSYCFYSISNYTVTVLCLSELCHLTTTRPFIDHCQDARPGVHFMSPGRLQRSALIDIIMRQVQSVQNAAARLSKTSRPHHTDTAST